MYAPCYLVPLTSIMQAFKVAFAQVRKESVLVDSIADFLYCFHQIGFVSALTSTVVIGIKEPIPERLQDKPFSARVAYKTKQLALACFGAYFFAFSAPSLIRDRTKIWIQAREKKE